jgi:hypothetical protein
VPAVVVRGRVRKDGTVAAYAYATAVACDRLDSLPFPGAWGFLYFTV